MEVRLLGPVGLWQGDHQIALARSQRRCVLAVLAIAPGQPVSSEALIDHVWGDRPPRDALHSLYTHISTLRRLLRSAAEADSGRATLRRQGDGYLLEIAPDQVDLHRARRLAGEARALGANGPGGSRQALERLREACSLWRGRPLDGLSSDWADRVRVGLEQEWLSLILERFGVELRLGGHAAVVGQVAALLADRPLVEPLVGLQMLALYRSGLQADALELYARTRRRLIDELGAEPSAELQRLHEQILRHDPALDLTTRPPSIITPGEDRTSSSGPGRAAPAQLPPDVVGFTGRTHELRQLDTLLPHKGEPRSATVVISTISGTAGIGKSALAIHAAHRYADRFPDGQLYIDLQGSTPGLSPLEPVAVLGRFLRALGMNAATIPSDLQEASAAFRSRTAERRLLVVLDNARDAAQVRPLLPASPGCAVLVTSRRLLAGLEGASHLELDVLPAEEAVELLGRLAGQQRVAAEPAAAAEVARWCGYLPLAVRIAGARLATRPGWRVQTLADRLADAQRRLDELELDDLGVRASLEVSYQELAASADPLDRAAARVFGFVGVLDGADVGAPVVSRLIDEPENQTELALERLVDVHLLETPTPGRYRLHDLVRLYARELAARQHSEAARAAAVTRAVGLYAATVWRTLPLLRPGDPRLDKIDARWRTGGIELTDSDAALAWLETERANLVAAVEQTATTPGVPDEITIQLAMGLFGFLLTRSYYDDLARVNQTALQVATRLGDLSAQARALNDLGVAAWHQGRDEPALACHQQSLTIYRELDDHRGQAASLGNLSILHGRRRQYEQALTYEQESLAIYRKLGDLRGQATSLSNLGIHYERIGDYRQALACHQESLEYYRQLGDRRGQAAALNNLGTVHGLLGDHQQARAHLHQSLAVSRELGDRWLEAFSLYDLGVVCQREGHHAQALSYLDESLAIRRKLGVRHDEAESLRELGNALTALGRIEEAHAHWRQALMILDDLGAPQADEVRALLAGRGASEGGDAADLSMSRMSARPATS